MNIFFLDISPSKCAQYHCDKHVVKMILELVQLLYSAHYIQESTLPTGAYKPISNIKHPMCIWVSVCEANYNYTVELANELSREYTLRYRKVHKCNEHLPFLRNNIPSFKKIVNYKPDQRFSKNKYFQSIGMTDIPLCMPVDSMYTDTIVSYRMYYKIHKKYFAKWKNTIPNWFTLFDIRILFN
uniref:Uncharacterized protein n=1 Tax=viral metagenome TaxID=1070528 RepID=A0A6C0I9T8_9ZZZZ